MRVFLFTLFVSLFLGVSLYAAIWYTQNYLQAPNPFENSVEVGHLGSLFTEKVSDTKNEEVPENDWNWEEDSTESIPPIEKSSEGNVRGIPESKPKPVVKKEKPVGTPRGKIDKNIHDFGSIDAGKVITHNFKVLNRGNTPLRITDFEVACGCTMVDFPKTAIQPGKSVEVKAVFNSKDKFGKQNKLVRLITNGIPKNLDVYFQGTVYPKDFGKEKPKDSIKEASIQPKDTVKGSE